MASSSSRDAVLDGFAMPKGHGEESEMEQNALNGLFIMYEPDSAQGHTILQE